MPEYLLHQHGRGKLWGDAEANLNTFIDRMSSGSGMAKLRDCVLLDSHAKDEVQIYGGTYHRTTIAGKTICAGSPQTYNSIIDCSEVSGKPQILACRLFGMTEICDAPNLVGFEARDAIIYGSPSIIGNFTVTGRVHEGTWTRAPRHIKLPWTEITECVVKNGEQHIICACRCRSVSYWLTHGPKLAKRWDWSEDQISVTLDTIRREFVEQVGYSGNGGSS